MTLNSIQYDNTKLSYVAKLLLEDQKGYRNNNCYNSGIKDISKIVDFEINYLKNKDIPYTMKEIYKNIHRKYSSKKILKYISDNLNCKIDEVKGIWLTTKYGVEKHYLIDDSYNEISCIDFSNTEYMIISDMDLEGVLIAYKGELICIAN